MDYDARLRELLEDFGRLPYPKPGEGSDTAEIQKEQDGIKAAIQAYGEARSRLFERLIQILSDPAADKVQMGLWFLTVSELRDELARTLGNAVHDVKTPSLVGLAFLTKVQTDEVRFYDALARAQAAAASRDYIAKYRKDVEDKTQALDTKWSELMRCHAEEISARASFSQLCSLLLEKSQRRGG